MGNIKERLRKWKINRMTGRGIVLVKLNKDKQGLKLLTKVIEMDPKNQMAWTGKGLALSRLRRHKEAIAAYKKALLLNPTDEERKQLDVLLKRAKEREKG